MLSDFPRNDPTLSPAQAPDHQARLFGEPRLLKDVYFYLVPLSIPKRQTLCHFCLMSPQRPTLSAASCGRPRSMSMCRRWRCPQQAAAFWFLFASCLSPLLPLIYERCSKQQEEAILFAAVNECGSYRECLVLPHDEHSCGQQSCSLSAVTFGNNDYIYFLDNSPPYFLVQILKNLVLTKQKYKAV